MTTKDLVGQILDIETQLEWCADPAEQIVLETELENLQSQLTIKVDRIDGFLVELQRRTSLIQAEIDTYAKEQKRLYSRRKAAERIKLYLERTILPLVVKTMGTDDIWETDTSRYTLTMTPGSVVVENEHLVPDDYKKATITVDKSKARKALLNGTPTIPGLRLERFETVRRS